MRELKFRAWDKNRMRMVYGPKWVTWIIDIFGVLRAVNYGFDGLEQKLEVMQYIGIKDCEDAELYSGDIIVVRENATSNWSTCGAEVFFSHEYVGGWVISIGGQNLNLGSRTENIKIIGNIHENPELLNNKSK